MRQLSNASCRASAAAFDEAKPDLLPHLWSRLFVVALKCGGVDESDRKDGGGGDRREDEHEQQYKWTHQLRGTFGRSCTAALFAHLAMAALP